MTARSPDQWWTETWSPWTGCTPHGAGCRSCHTLARLRRHLPAMKHPGPPDEIVFHPEHLGKLRHWRKPRVILTCMNGDWFHERVTFDDRCRAWVAMLDSPQHTYVLLTKRWDSAVRWLSYCQRDVPEHFILMASVATQSEADAACSCLSRLQGVRWGLHVEPMIEAIDLTTQPRAGRPINGATVAECSGALERWQTTPMRAKLRDGASWVVCGAEQGPGARPFNPDWALSLLEQCRAASVPFWMKQFSGRTEPPEDLRVRETPWRSQ